MKDLIDNVKTFLTTDLVSGSVKVVEKGIPENPQLIPFTNYPYIRLGDGGERTEDDTGTQNQNRYFSIEVVFAVFATDLSVALDGVLDLSNSIKGSIELLANRQVDGLVWGRSVTPFDWEDEKGFYVGRTVVLEYRELDDMYFDH